MNRLKETPEINQLVVDYFSDPNRRLKLKKDDVIIRQGEFNDTLYLIISGQLEGLFENPDGSRFKIFAAGPGMFAGVYSFFSGTFQGSSTVIATTPGEVALLRYREIERKIGGRDCLASRFMPVIMDEMLHRQRRLQDIHQEKEQTLRRLIHSKQMATLGQMAAGISHELNNAISVIERNTVWLSRRVQDLLAKASPATCHFAENAMQKGRSISSRDTRRRAEKLRQRIPLDESIVRRLAQIDMPDALLASAVGGSAQQAEAVLDTWELGASLHDVLIAARQAVHVVGSVKTLGASELVLSDTVDVNESLREAIALMRSGLRDIRIQLDLDECPPLVANRGELLQIWTNLIQNASESLSQSRVANPEINIVTRVRKRCLQVRIQDNGPGIAPDILPQIFQPNVTTKVNGLSFGLGLGLAIVARLADHYQGSIAVESQPGKTVFNVELPLGGRSGN